MYTEWSTDGEFEDVAMHATLRADSLELASAPGTTEGVGGTVSMSADITVRGLDEIHALLNFESPGMTYPLGEETEATPALRLTSETFLRTEETLRTWSLDSARLRLDDFVTASVSGSFDAGTSSFDVTLEEGRVRNPRMLRYLPVSLQSQMAGMSLFGEEVLAGRMNGRSESDSVMISLAGVLRIEDAAATVLDPPMDMRRVKGSATFEGNASALKGRVDVTVGILLLKEIRESPVEDGRIAFEWAMDADGGMRIEKGVLDAAGLGIHGMYGFSVMPEESLSTVSGDAVLGFQSEEPVEIAGGMLAAGGVECRVHAKSLRGGTQALRIEGDLRLDSLTIDRPGLFRVSDVRGCVPFSVDGDLASARLMPRAGEFPLDLDAYARRRAAFLSMYPRIGIIQTGALEFAGYRADGLRMDVYVGSGFFQIPAFNIDVFGGNLGGAVDFDVGAGFEQVRYDFRAQASRINSAALLPGGSGLDEQNELNATLAFRGRGLDVTQGLDLQGGFYITKIGPRFAATLLESLDPTGSDRSIRMTRRLLNTGWKPKLFSFELRHGYVYPSISLAQPWFSPIRIPGNLEYARLPLDFFLTSIQP